MPSTYVLEHDDNLEFLVGVYIFSSLSAAKLINDARAEAMAPSRETLILPPRRSSPSMGPGTYRDRRVETQLEPCTTAMHTMSSSSKGIASDQPIYSETAHTSACEPRDKAECRKGASYIFLLFRNCRIQCGR